MIVGMNERRNVLSRILRGASDLSRLSVRRRTVMILIPVHLVAFMVLYLGLVRVMRSEMLRTHSAGARVLLTEAVHTLHPLMCSKDHSVIPVSVGEFARSHELLDFRMYRSDGSLMGSPGHPVPQIREFLESSDEDRFHFVDKGDVLALSGILRIRAEGDCTTCHQQGVELGAAAMEMDRSGSSPSHPPTGPVVPRL